MIVFYKIVSFSIEKKKNVFHSDKIYIFITWLFKRGFLMYIKLVLVAIGITIGYKNRANLLYIVFFLLPFFSLGQLKVINNIHISQLFFLLCFIPLTLLFALDLITKKYKKDYFFIFAGVVGLYLFILTRSKRQEKKDRFPFPREWQKSVN